MIRIVKKICSGLDEKLDVIESISYEIEHDYLHSTIEKLTRLDLHELIDIQRCVNSRLAVDGERKALSQSTNLDREYFGTHLSFIEAKLEEGNPTTFRIYAGEYGSIVMLDMDSMLDLKEAISRLEIKLKGKGGRS